MFFNLPTLLTWARIVAIPLIVGVFYLEGLSEKEQNLIATVLFVVFAATDWADGYLARRLNQTSAFGAFLDPVADKFLVCASLLVLVHMNRADVFVALIIIGREMFVSSLRGILEKEGKDFSASFIGKLKMVLQCVAVSVSLLSMAPLLQFSWTALFRDATLYLAVAATLWSGAVYVARGFSLLRDA